VEAIEKLIGRVEKFKASIPFTINKVVKENEAIIIDLIVEDQLFERGVDADNRSLGGYSPITIQIKQQKGQPTNRITLRDTEAYHKSYGVKTLSEGGFEVTVSDVKYGEIIQRFPKTDALTDENLQDILRNYILPELLKQANRL
jgi:hypothetical protein